MTITDKMLSRIFSRTVSIYYVITAGFLLFFFLYEMKQFYHRFQKERRFAFYNTYVNEVYNYADEIETSQIRSSKQIKCLSKVLRIAFKKNSTDDER